ncbi:MAG: hypothetical protein JWQ97_3143 [Phenylobacterium sp.]|nr:hypothetical protein [Phenylobacterium sp.]
MADAAFSPKHLTILKYFEASDGGRFPAELFTEDFQFFVPKFGVGRGMADFGEMAGSVGMKRIRHHVDEFLVIEQGDTVAVEGTTEGLTGDDVEWRGGRTPAGRFASIFVFSGEGLIERMHIYLDPDFSSAHADGFRWNRAAAQTW